jgi:hypothetical protein
MEVVIVGGVAADRKAASNIIRLMPDAAFPAMSPV